VDSIINGDIDFMINTTAKGSQALADSLSIRRTALTYKIPYYTLLTAARAGVQAIQSMKDRDMEVKSLQEFFRKDEDTEREAAE